jgi:hypothetical protein
MDKSSMRHLIREGSKQSLNTAGSWLVTDGYLQLPVSPGFAPGSLLMTPEKYSGANRNEYVNEQYNTTNLVRLADKI